MTPKHSANLTGPSGRFRFGQNLLLVLARVRSSFWTGQNLWIRAGRFAPTRHRGIAQFRI
jgi:hypothetical protein